MKTLSFRSFLWTQSAVVMATLSACGGGSSAPPAAPPPAPPPPATYSVTGIVAGLSGSGLVLQNNGGNDLAVTNNGAMTFASNLANGASFSITVKTQPTNPWQTCNPLFANGTINGASVTNAQIQCSTSVYKLGGTIQGLKGTGLVLTAHASNDFVDVPLAASGHDPDSFVIGSILSGLAYGVIVKSQPTNPVQNCTVANGSGTVGGSDISIVVTCVTATPVACSESGTVVTHANNVAANETWAGNGTVHLIPNSISILAPAVVTIQPCAIVKLKSGVSIDVSGAASGTSQAKLVAAGNDFVSGSILFTNADTQPWGRVRGVNKNSIVELNFTQLQNGGNVGGSQRNATIAMNGSSTHPDPTLKVNGVTVTNSAGVGVYLSDAAFTTDSKYLDVAGGADYAMAMTAMATGSIPIDSVWKDNLHNEALVVENANITDNLTIKTPYPIHFKTDGVHVGGLAPDFVQNVTLTLEAGVTLKFERASTKPTLVTFGDLGQTMNKNAALVVHGTPGDSVLFTSGEANPAPGDWAGIWLATSSGSQLNHVVIEYAGGDAAIGPRNCGPFDPSINQPARHTAALLVGDNDPLQYVPPPDLITNSVFRNNAGNFAIDSVWDASIFGPTLDATNSFGAGPKFCKQSKNFRTGGCVVSGVDQSGCLVP